MPLPAQIIHIRTVAGLPDHDNTAVPIGGYARTVTPLLSVTVLPGGLGRSTRAAELGPGPGVGLQEALRRFRGAQVWGIDPSPVMLAQSRKRNLADVQAGRLAVVQGSVACLGEIAPLDAVVANHVLYFWHQPADELRRSTGICDKADCSRWATS